MTKKRQRRLLKSLNNKQVSQWSFMQCYYAISAKLHFIEVKPHTVDCDISQVIADIRFKSEKEVLDNYYKCNMYRESINNDILLKKLRLYNEEIKRLTNERDY